MHDLELQACILVQYCAEALGLDYGELTCLIYELTYELLNEVSCSQLLFMR